MTKTTTIAAAWVLALLCLMFGSGSAMAFSTYLSGAGGFNSTYPSSTTGTNASCDVCHSSGGGTPLNAYGKDWATQHNGGMTAQAAFKAIESTNSDHDPTGSTNLAEITANAQPGWTPGPHNTLYDIFTLAVAATNQNPPAVTGNVLDPVVATNHPPVLAPIGAKSVNEGLLLAFTATATDPDGNTLTFTAGGLPSGATLSSAGAFSWTPNFAQSGNYNVTITVTDNGSPPLSAFEIVTITVGNVNRPPVIGAIAASQSATAGVLKTIPITATDPDGNGIVIAGSNLPTGATVTDNLNGTATFAWTPTVVQTGSYPNVTITATDNGTPPLSATAQFTITVTDGNQPPVLAPIGNKTAQTGVLLAFQATATDPDGNALTFSGGNLPAGATLTPAGAFSWTPDASQIGPFTMTITVTDNGVPPQNASETFTITVGGVNQPPVLAPIGAQTVNEGQLLSFIASATDPDGNALTFTGTDLPAGATLTPAGAFSWTPDYTQAGSYNVTITVTDNGSPPLSAFEVVTITVGDVDRPPVLSPKPIGDRTVTVGQTLTIALTASDPDGDTLAFAGANLPPGATLTPNGSGAATFSWTPVAGQEGIYPNVSIAVSDGVLSDVDVFAITVKAATPPPPPPVPVPPPAAASVTLQAAEWDDSRLQVKGKVSPAGTTVTVIDADTGRTLGTATARSRDQRESSDDGSSEGSDREDSGGAGEWKLEVKLDAAPCRVQAQAGGQVSAIVVVRGTGHSCGTGSRHRDDD